MFWKKSHLLTTILTPALRVWLTSQLETVQGLELHLISSDQQFLRGIIPKVILRSEFAIYQGLQFDQISLTAQDIEINLSSLLKGEPLQPLKPIPIAGKVRMSESHLNQSLTSSLLQSGIHDFLALLLKTDTFDRFHWDKITLKTNQFILQGTTINSSPQPTLIVGEVHLTSPNLLLISPVTIEGLDFNHQIAPIEFDLGSQVHLENLNLTQEAIFLEGNLMVIH